MFSANVEVIAEPLLVACTSKKFGNNNRLSRIIMVALVLGVLAVGAGPVWPAEFAGDYFA
jgi:hypothetical protein